MPISCRIGDFGVTKKNTVIQKLVAMATPLDGAKK